MNEEEKQTIERIKRDYELAKSEDAIDIDIFTEDIKTVLNLLEKKDKIIDLIAKELVKAHEWFYSEFDNYTKEDFIKYFEKKVEEDR